MTNVSQPTILLACVNSNDGKGRITSLLHERRAIAQQLAHAEDVGACRIIQEDVSPRSSFIHLLDKHAFVEPVSILHISGPLDSLPNFTIRELSAVVGKLPEIKLVFLNGSATLELVEMLLLKNIPAVIVTQTITPDPKLKNISSTFYEAMGKGSNIKEAFEYTQHNIDDQFQSFTASYDLDTDKLIWNTTSIREENPYIPWGIYQLEGMASQLDWAFVSAEQAKQISKQTRQVINQPTTNKVTPPSEELLFQPAPSYDQIEQQIDALSQPAFPWKLVGIITSILLLISFLGWIGWTSLKPDKTATIPPKGEKFRVVMLSMKNNDICGKEDLRYAGAVLSELKYIEEEREELEVIQLAIPTCESDKEFADKIMDEQKADMIIWGNTRQMAGDSTQIHLNSLLRAKASNQYSILFRERSLMAPEHVYPEKHNSLTEAVNSITMLGMGNYWYEREDYKEAVYLLQKVKPADGEESSWYLNRVAYSLNQVGRELIKLKKNTLAWDAFNQAVSIDPEFTEAYYNRGLISLKEKRFDEAIRDMDKVISLQPAVGRPFGILAAIYASQKDEDLFYKNLELCLSKGTDISQYINYTAVKDYQREPRFKALLAKYAK